MRPSLETLPTERAQAWLGTLVSIRVSGLPPPEAHWAISKAFEEVAAIHGLMSFHQPASDVSLLNGAVPGTPVEVHPYTYEVLRSALLVAAYSEGCFDISVAPELVKWGLLPKRQSATLTATGGRWCDIELLPHRRVIFHRPLSVDLGGIAKGYAVDRAIESLSASGATSVTVNAGGDIRVAGEETEYIRLELEAPSAAAPIVELTAGSVASSSGHMTRRESNAGLRSAHVDGRTRTPARTDRFVCVLSKLCTFADALTKVVMVEGEASKSVLRQFEAVAHFFDPETGWHHIDGEPSTA